jgi:hypothetical protein
LARKKKKFKVTGSYTAYFEIIVGGYDEQDAISIVDGAPTTTLMDATLPPFDVMVDEVELIAEM